MKKYLMFMSAIVLGASTIFMSSCKDDEGGDPVIVEPSLIKTISIDYSGGAGEEVESWQFNYDDNDRIASIDVFGMESQMEQPFMTILLPINSLLPEERVQPYIF